MTWSGPLQVQRGFPSRARGPQNQRKDNQGQGLLEVQEAHFRHLELEEPTLLPEELLDALMLLEVDTLVHMELEEPTLLPEELMDTLMLLEVATLVHMELEEPTLLPEELLDTLMLLEVDTLVHLGQATQHSLETTLLSLAIHLLQKVILLPSRAKAKKQRTEN